MMALLPLAILGCKKETALEEPAADRIVTIRASVPELTKVNGAYDGTALKLTWEEGDQLYVADHSDPVNKYEVFTLTDGAGTKSATFSGKEITAASYDINYSNLPDAFAGITQSADKNTDHLSFGLWLEGVSSYENIAFSDAWATSKGGTLKQNAALHLSAALPEGVAATVSSAEIVASLPIFAGGNSLSFKLGTPGDAGSDGILDVFATLPVGGGTIPSGTEFLIKFSTTDEAHSVYTRYYKAPTAIEIRSGKLSLISLDCTKAALHAGSPSSDGSAEKPYLIGDKYQMQAMKDAASDSHYKLVDDIDLDGFSWTSLNAEGSTVLNFDGNGKTISHLGKPLFTYINGTVSDLTITNAALTVTGNYNGILCRTINQGTCVISNVSIKNSSITTADKGYIGGFVGRVDTGGTSLTLSDCSATDVTVNGAAHYAGGLIAYANMANITIERCHTSGTVTTESGSGRHVGGLVGGIATGPVTINDSYSDCTVHGYQFYGGLVGSILSNGSGAINRSYATGEVSATKGNAGAGGLVGSLEVTDFSITKSVAWNGKVAPPSGKIGLTNYSSGAVVGRTHPNCVLTDNYRNPAMELTAYWVPSANYDHPNVNGTTAPLVRIGTDLVEANAVPATETSISGDNGRWAYHGKHVAAGTTLSTLASTTLGWSSSVWDFSGDLPKLINNP